jgi:enoyl-CoA hydratase/carnithine racemase
MAATLTHLGGTMDYETILVQQADRIGIITLNRPDKRNALSIQVRQEMTACLERWEADDDVGVVIISGEGPVFSAGFDLKEFGKADLIEEVFKSSTIYHRAVWHFPKPTIAAINGPAFGGGFDLTTLCDIRICAPDAAFAHPEIKFGAPPLYTPLRWIVGSGLARDLCLTGRTIGAEEALRIGLVSEVVNGQGVLDRAMSLAKTILEAPLPTLETTKRYMAADEGAGFDESFAAEHDVPFENFVKLFKAGN